jgi:hypothetical protein
MIRFNNGQLKYIFSLPTGGANELVLVRLIKTQQNVVFQLSRIIHCAVEVSKLEREKCPNRRIDLQ